MTTIVHLLYESQVSPLSDILCDLNIATTAATVSCTDIEKIINNVANTINTYDATDGKIINEYNIKDIVVILDKLQCTDAVNMLLTSDIVPENIACATATINHSLTREQLRDTYARTAMYGALYNNHSNNTFYANNKIRNAIQNGLNVTNILIPSSYAATDNDIVCCPSLAKLSIYNGSQITSLAPFAKTLHTLHINTKYKTCLIDDNTISSCTNLVELYASQNCKITTCTPFAKSLKILNAAMHISYIDNTIIMDDNCGITDHGLSLCANIEILYATDNIRITTCAPFANTLKILYAGGRCGIANNGLSLCTSIQRLCTDYNNKITTCAPFANTIEILHVEFSNYNGNLGGITDTGLSLCLKIVELNAQNKPQIRTCAPFAYSLKKLNASNDLDASDIHCCGILDAGLSLCSIICKLNADRNSNITTCAPFAKSLKILYASEHCGISDTGLSKCIAIKKLCANDNPKITTCKPFARTLVILEAYGDSGICDEGLSRCTTITNLMVANNPRITTCAPFSKTLNKLDASNFLNLICRDDVYEYCGIGDEGLTMCNSIKILQADDNQKITTCAPFAHTLKHLFANYDCGICDKGLQLCDALTYVSARDNDKITILDKTSRSGRGTLL